MTKSIQTSEAETPRSQSGPAEPAPGFHPGNSPRTRLSSVRARTTIAATLVVAAALVSGGIGLFVLLDRTMIHNLDNSLHLRAVDIDRLIQTGRPPETIAIEDESDGFVQIVGPSGEVVASSANIDGEPAISDESRDAYSTLQTHAIDNSRFRVHTYHATNDRATVIIVGSTLEDTDEILRVIRISLSAGLPALLLLVAGTTWTVTGRTLKPVESIRAEVAAIGGRDLHRRVPQPRTHDEIGRLASTMNDMLDRLESSNDRLQQFVSDASHELRTPIATIRHELEIGLRSDASNWPEIAAEVLDEDLRMQRMVDDLIWLARHDQAAGDRERMRKYQLVDLDELAFDEAQRRRSESSVLIDTTGIGAGQVRGNTDDLRRVVRNLIDNAHRHAASRVAISLVSHHGQVNLHIDDDGAGVAIDDRERIFERFTRADEARARDDGGVGLGLAITREIMHSHGGTIAVSSSPHLGGARFTVTLPDQRSSDPTVV